MVFLKLLQFSRPVDIAVQNDFKADEFRGRGYFLNHFGSNKSCRNSPTLLSHLGREFL
jgi:hypothetical protein